jgi:hypothetical protein
MKTKLVKLLLITFLVTACGATPAHAGSGPVPICYPGTPCAAQFGTTLSGPPLPEPICFPGHPCARFDGPFPEPICFPGRPCAAR